MTTFLRIRPLWCGLIRHVNQSHPLMRTIRAPAIIPNRLFHSAQPRQSGFGYGSNDPDADELEQNTGSVPGVSFTRQPTMKLDTRQDANTESPIDPIPAGKVPEYNGPSIKEHQTSQPVKVDKKMAKEMKENRDREFADSLFEEVGIITSTASDPALESGVIAIKSTIDTTDPNVETHMEINIGGFEELHHCSEVFLDPDEELDDSAVAAASPSQPRSLEDEEKDWDSSRVKKPRYDNMPTEQSDTDAFGQPKKKRSTKLTGAPIDEELGSSRRRFSSRNLVDEDEEDPLGQERLKDEDPDKLRKKLNHHKESVIEHGQAAAEDVLAAAPVAKAAVKQAAAKTKSAAKQALGETKKVAGKVKDKLKHVAEVAFTPVSDVYDNTNARKKEELYPVSDSEGAREGFKLSFTPEGAAEVSGASLGEDVNALRKSILEGPQDMPQGKGKRAKDESGRPMETGAEGT